MNNGKPPWQKSELAREVFDSAAGLPNPLWMQRQLPRGGLLHNGWIRCSAMTTTSLEDSRQYRFHHPDCTSGGSHSEGKEGEKNGLMVYWRKLRERNNTRNKNNKWKSKQQQAHRSPCYIPPCTNKQAIAR
nr:PREDICTED: uncharacterized protein LOC103976636 [Musa acuminata subsp. malaccensis]